MQDARHEPEHETPPDERTLGRIRSFRLIDDLFMRICFAHSLICAQVVLRIVLNRPDLEVVSVRMQHTVQAMPGHRSLQVDALIRDSAGGLHNLEMQRKEADVRRFRLHAAMLDASELEAGADFADLPDLNVIFIMERDPLKQGLPLYEFVRYMPRHDLPLNDGVRIVLVNGEIRGRQTKLAELMHDIFCADPAEMYIEELAEVVRYFKQTDKGIRKMSSVVEEIREEGKIEGRVEGRAEGAREANIATALHMLRMKRFTLKDIAEATRLGLDTVEELAAGNTADARDRVERERIVREEKTATVLQLVRMGGFTVESIAEITRLRVDEVRAILENKAS